MKGKREVMPGKGSRLSIRNRCLPSDLSRIRRIVYWSRSAAMGSTSAARRAGM